MQERALYCFEDGKWYRQGDDPWTVKFVPRGTVIKPIFSVRSDSNLDAFEQLFGHPLQMPALIREGRHSQEAA